SEGCGPTGQLEQQFESTCALLDTNRLPLFGIACVDDRERLGENVYGAGGLVEFLQRRRAEGRLGSLFCTTHGDPAYIRELLRRDLFDAIMLAWNPLGFHLLSWHPHAPIPQENLAGNREMFALAAARRVGVLVMKPLAGGLLLPGDGLRGPPARGRARPLGARGVARDLGWAGRVHGRARPRLHRGGRRERARRPLAEPRRSGAGAALGTRRRLAEDALQSLRLLRH